MLLDKLEYYSHTDRNAAYDGKEFMSFSELWDRTENIACKLIDDYNTKKPVAIFGDKENDMISCMFGAIKAGKPYICIPSYYPSDRIKEILSDSEADVILSPCPDAPAALGLPVIASDSLRESAPYTVSPDNYLKPGELASIIYTSGSTGKPKGIEIIYDNLEEKIEYHRTFMKPSMAEYGVGMNLASYAFSASVGYIYYVMMDCGYTLYGVPKNILMNISALVEYMISSHVNVFSCTPTMARRLLNCEKFTAENLPELVYVCLGGEPLVPEIAKKISQKFPSLRLLNGIGVSETFGSGMTLDIGKLTDGFTGNYMPIGKIGDKYGYLGDENGEPVTEEGSVGELIMHGKIVSNGYLNNPEQTKAAFFVNKSGERAYRTHDIIMLKDGLYYYKGRKDNQVKIGGNRVELEEVEAKLREVENIVGECAATAVEIADGVNILVAFVVKKDASVSNAKSFIVIKKKLKMSVQNYIIPTKIIFVDQLPKNNNMKIDRAELKRIASEKINA